MARPPITSSIQKGQALASVAYIRETLNWVIAWVSNLKAGEGLELVNRDTDNPTIKLKKGSGGGGSANCVYDVSENESKQLVVSYVDDRTDKTIDILDGETESQFTVVTEVDYSSGTFKMRQSRVNVQNGIIKSITDIGWTNVFETTQYTPGEQA